jgi:nitrite reductase/ring-hydroxylating ferredoxin subunit
LSAERTGWSAAITVFRDGDDFFALDDTCSHAEASLADGYIDDGCVECPLHGALFRLSDGAALTLPAVRPVRAHRVEVVDGTVRLYPGTAA